MSHQTNITRIRAVYNALGDLRNDVVFVGGATVSLYADQRAEEVRPTEDIDVVVEIMTHRDFSQLDERLRNLGFKNDQDSGIICRYIINGLIVDIMPIHDEAIGFANKWYPKGFELSEYYEISENLSVRIFAPVYFLASKLEAFKSRGKNDWRTSKDFEDIVFLLENRSQIWHEMESAEGDVKAYLKNELRAILNNPFVEEWVDSHAGFGVIPATAFIINSMQKFVEEG